MKRGLRELGVICLLAMVPALLAAWLQPKRPPASGAYSIASISVGQASALGLGQTVLWIDARPEAAFKAGHIPGAWRLTEGDWETLLPHVADAWSPAAPVIVYCDHLTCDSSRQVAARLRRELPIERIYVLEGGWERWNQARKK
jgi:rhodanese-related sulfurtransferase